MKKSVCLVSSIIAIIYSIFYAELGGFKGNAGALSKIGLSHPTLFTIWGILTCVALFSNIIVAFSTTKYRFHFILITISLIGMIMTLCFDFDYSKYSQYILHCIGSITFSILSGITVFLLFLLKKDYFLMTITSVILISDLVLLIIFKETAFIELMPIFFGYIMLLTHNLRREKEKIEIK